MGRLEKSPRNPMEREENHEEEHIPVVGKKPYGKRLCYFTIISRRDYSGVVFGLGWSTGASHSGRIRFTTTAGNGSNPERGAAV